MTGNENELEPDHHDDEVSRWHVADGAVVADRHPSRAGVYFHARHEDERRITDPGGLIAALRAAEASLREPPEQLGLQPDTQLEQTWSVSWVTDEEARSPLAAARRIWADVFGRVAAGPNDACVFVVTDPVTGRSVRVDLSEFDKS